MHPSRRPKVSRHQLGDIKAIAANDKSAEVIIIENAFHDTTVAAALAIYFELLVPCCVGDNRYFRCFVTDPAKKGDLKASFQMGKDASTRYYKAFDAHDVEANLTKVLESVLRIAYKKKYGDAFDCFLNQGAVNIAILSHRKGFSKHDDSNKSNTKDDDLAADDYKGGTQQAFLPTRDMLPIVTAVFTGPKCDLPEDLQNFKNYKLDWYAFNSMKSLLSLETGHNAVHIQFSCQQDLVHDGNPIELSVGSHSWRLTISFQPYCNPMVNEAAWISRCRCLSIEPSSLPPLIGDSKEERVYGVLDLIKNPHKQE